MSDNKAGTDVASEQDKAPIKPEEVVVEVKPRQTSIPKKISTERKEQMTEQNQSNADRAKRAAGNENGGAIKEVRDAIKKAAPAGREAQKDAAEQAAQDVGKKLDRKVFKEVKVSIPGEEPIVAPASEEGPTPPPRKKS